MFTKNSTLEECRLVTEFLHPKLFWIFILVNIIFSRFCNKKVNACQAFSTAHNWAYPKEPFCPFYILSTSIAYWKGISLFTPPPLPPHLSVGQSIWWSVVLVVGRSFTSLIISKRGGKLHFHAHIGAFVENCSRSRLSLIYTDRGRLATFCHPSSQPKIRKLDFNDKKKQCLCTYVVISP